MAIIKNSSDIEKLRQGGAILAEILNTLSFGSPVSPQNLWEKKRCGLPNLEMLNHHFRLPAAWSKRALSGGCLCFG